MNLLRRFTKPKRKPPLLQISKVRGQDKWELFCEGKKPKFWKADQLRELRDLLIFHFEHEARVKA